MEKKLDIHKTEEKLKTYLKIINKLSERNRNLILDFQKECFSRGLSDNRVLFYIYRMSMIARQCNKDLNKLSIQEIKEIIANIERNKNYSEWTKACYKLAIKKFYQWLEGYEWESKEYPEKVKWIKTTARKERLRDPVILTKEEVLKLFNVAEGVREKALVSFMYESGCRVPDELLNMKVSDVEFDDYGAKVRLRSGKVGSRIIRVVACVPHLKAWVETEHPDPKPNNYLWVRKGSAKVISYSTLKNLIKKWRIKAGINKQITPYTFRRTRYTHLATKIPTPALYNYMGQVQGSDVIERYVKLSGEDTDEAILNFYGITNPKNSDIKPLFCSRCGKQNPPEKEYCIICNAPLTEKARANVEENKKKELSDFIEELIRKRMEELKNQKR
ncbi:MAG: tyrosine-type recombinase/integrase [Candidatus Aenigmatarchaeota archaeon]